MRYMYVLCGNMMNDPQHCCLYSPLGYLANTQQKNMHHFGCLTEHP